jgi:hypothetical protein
MVAKAARFATDSKGNTEDEHDVFCAWLLLRNLEWRQFKVREGSMITFHEYLTARSVYIQEKNNG